VQEAERKLNREINYTVLRTGDFLLKKKRRDAFIMQLMQTNKIMLVGNLDDFTA